MSSINDAVLLHAFGMLDKEQSRVMERARKTDPVVHELLRLLDPNTDDPSETLLQFGEAIAYDITCIEAWGPVIRAADQRGHLVGDMPPMPLSSRGELGSRSMWHERIFGAAAKSKSAEDKVDASLPAPPYVCVRDDVLLSVQAEMDVPFGLVQLVAMREGRPIHTKIAVMEHDANGKRWTLEYPLSEFFSGDLPDGNLEYYLVPLDQSYASWIRPDRINELKQIHRSLPESQALARERLEEFIDFLESPESEDTYA